jgi:hypothetical protein
LGEDLDPEPSEQTTTTVSAGKKLSGHRSGSIAKKHKQSVIKGPWRLLRFLPRNSRLIISRMLDLDPSKRPTLSEVLAEPWIKNITYCYKDASGKVVRADDHTHTPDLVTRDLDTLSWAPVKTESSSNPYPMQKLSSQLQRQAAASRAAYSLDSLPLESKELSLFSNLTLSKQQSFIQPITSTHAKPKDIFIYKRFSMANEIRLLEILPGDGLDTLKCRIFHALYNHQQYDAISYTWGSEEGKSEITLLPSGVEISVTANCKAVLYRLRRPKKKRVLWIDAIGINHEDIEERNAQVGIMSKIYTRAERVLVYLGDESDDSKLAMDAIKDDNDLFVYKKAKLKAVQSLLGRPWFNRVCYAS